MLKFKVDHEIDIAVSYSPLELVIAHVLLKECKFVRNIRKIHYHKRHTNVGLNL